MSIWIKKNLLQISKARKQIDYHWQGLNSSGRLTEGFILAPNKTVAEIILHQQKIQIQSLARTHSLFTARKSTIKPEDIIQFVRQMAILLNAQIPLIQAFDALKRGNSNVSIQTLLEHIKHNIQTGISFAEALRQHPQHFSTLVCHLIDAGEQSGNLSVILLKIAQLQEQALKIKKKIKAAMIYPCIIVGIAITITTALLVFVVPEFIALFNQFGATLPLFTRGFIQASVIIRTYGAPCFMLFLMSIFISRYIYQHHIGIANTIDHWILKIPLLGQMLEEAITARVSHTLSITLTSGLPLMDALTLIERVSGNRAYAKAISSIREHIRQGLTLEHAIRLSKRFPSIMIQMVAIGEESGKLEAMLAHIAKQYDELFYNSAELLTRLLEPFLMIILGLLIGALIIAMYLPIFQLGAVI